MHPIATPISVRPITSNDRTLWTPLWLAYQAFYEVSLSEEVTQTTFERFLNPAEPVFAVVATQGDELIGFAHSVVHRSTWSTDNFCYLEDLFVAPTVRGGGTGKLLIESIQAFAQAQQCSRLYWHTHASNKQAQKLYDWVAQNLGFIEYRMAL